MKYQESDGILPLRVEREYQTVKLVPGLRKFSKPIFNFIEKIIKGRDEHPVYEGRDVAGGSGAEDTIPAILIASGEFFMASEEGRKFISEHFDQLKKAVEYFEKKTDDTDGLAIITKDMPDWADSLTRKGKLGGINVWWARSLRLMAHMAKELGHEDDARHYTEEFRKVEEGVMDKIYNKSEGYFRAAEGDNRLDTVASIFGALYFLSPEEAVRVEGSLSDKVLCNTGLQNFDKPYPKEQIFWSHKLTGWNDYHNKFVWPWVTLENIQVKIKIALQHPDESVRAKYKKEAIDDLVYMAKVFEEVGGVYEVVDPNSPKPAKMPFYTPVKNFMGSMSAFQGAYGQLKNLGWI